MTTPLLTRDGLQERAGGIRDYVSASRLNLWLKCPLAFRLRYIDGVRTPPTPSLFLGKVVHASLETYYRHRQLGLALDREQLDARLVESWGLTVDAERMVFESAADEQLLQKQAVALVAAYLAQVPADEPRPLAVEVAAEAPLVDPTSGEDLGIPLVGVIDLVLAAAGGPSIIDFKTSARSGEPLEIVHEVQLTGYSYLFRHSSEAPESGLEIRTLVKTKKPQIQVYPYGPRTDQHFERFFALVRAYLDDLDAGRFVFRPGLGCGMCDYREPHCRAWTG